MIPFLSKNSVVILRVYLIFPFLLSSGETWLKGLLEQKGRGKEQGSGGKQKLASLEATLEGFCQKAIMAFFYSTSHATNKENLNPET